MLLASVAAFFIYSYVVAAREKYALSEELAQKKELIVSLENEKQRLLQDLDKVTKEKGELKDNLRASRKRLSRLFVSLASIQSNLDQANTQISLLKAENAALTEQKSSLEQENDAFRAKLSSSAELKKAIKELKRQAQKVGVHMIKKAETEKTLEGNQGYIIKDGFPTTPAKVRIEVTPASAVKE